jgi:hypothetical protein
MTPNAIFKMDFDIKLKWRLIQIKWKDSNKFLKRSKEVLTHEMTKMPLGAILTKKWPNWYFWNEFWHEIETRAYTNQFKRLKQFSKIKMNWMQEMTKIPFYVDFANNIEIKCRERCNWS